MPPNNTLLITETSRLKKYFRWLFPLAIVIILAALAFFLYTRFVADKTEELQQVQLDAFTDSLVLSLDATVTDPSGIPYSGVVRFNPQTQTYSQVANTDEGTIMPLGELAFARDGKFLAQRIAASSSDLVLYDPTTLASKRVVTLLDSGTIVGATFWSQNADKIGYFIIGPEGADLVVEDADGTNQTSLGRNYPIGFSPDASKVLLRSVPALLVLDIETERTISTTGTAFVDMENSFVLSPSGEFLVSYSKQQIDWYTVNWATSEITHKGVIPTQTSFADVVFTFDNTLIVRVDGNDLLTEYTFKEGEGVIQKSLSEVKLPAGARILNVVTW